MVGVVAHHESVLGRGTGIKPSDYETLPLCSSLHNCHGLRHDKGKDRFWTSFCSTVDYKKEIIRNLIEYFGKDQKDNSWLKRNAR